MFRSRTAIAISLLLSLAIVGCAPETPDASNSASTPETVSPTNDETTPDLDGAVVTAVETTPQNGDEYTFSVTIESPDTGCDQYANWWEVISEDGALLYRRILAHSHVNEQPFERSGGPVAIAPDQTVIVRAHMHPDGYGTQAMQGSPDTGFQTTTLAPDFAAALAEADPQANDCTF